MLAKLDTEILKYTFIRRRIRELTRIIQCQNRNPINEQYQYGKDKNYETSYKYIFNYFE